MILELLRTNLDIEIKDNRFELTHDSWAPYRVCSILCTPHAVKTFISQWEYFKPFDPVLGRQG